MHTKIEGGIHTNGVKCIDEASCLYSNVDDLDADTNRILHVKRKVNIVHKKVFTKYVMLKVEYRTDSSTFDLEKIEDLKKFIATNNNIWYTAGRLPSAFIISYFSAVGMKPADLKKKKK